MEATLRRITLLLLALTPSFSLASVLTNMDVRQTSSGETELVLQFSGGVAEMNSYRLDAPPRLALDLADTQSGLAQRRVDVGSGGVERITALEGSGRTRLVVDLNEPLEYRSRVEGSQLRITLGVPSANGTVDARETAQGPRVEHIDFQRGSDGAGLLLVTFDRAGVVSNVREASGGRVIAELRDVDLPAALNQVYDVTDFATPISRITPRIGQRGTSLELQTSGAYAMISSQSGQTLTIEVQPVRQVSQQVGEQQSDSYTGKRLNLNFHDVEVRAVLVTLAEFMGLNLVASDSITGRITLNLNEVPWDQALALILQSQGLSSREQGNVIVVAPASELAARERQEIEIRNQRETLSPLVSEFIEVKYARAEELAQLLRGGDGFGLLTERGRVSVDKRTNILVVQDTAEQVRDIARTLERLDVAVRQVQIEARIVIARDTASRELGINWGASSTRGFQANDAGGYVGRNINPDGLNRAMGGLTVDLGSMGAASTGFSFGYLSGDILLDLELRALESEGKSQTISQPRVITANQRTAIIRQGEERAFQSVDSQGNPDTEFKEAELSLEVTPQITPDNRIIMDLVIKNDSFRESEFGGEPPIDTNQIETQVLVDNGQTVVLGGILTTEQLSQIAKTPLLGDLPMIGRLFRYTEESNEKVELLVFITPRLLDDGLAIR
ncbi:MULTISPECIES: type IV pilus secretin family protein [unclassified Halomonas]|uniref:type IV pilus secretin family protein n=1 Tax=unclassified Halomonas TaxID=2609666 RepID=UPI000990692C|nr:MULTISPECIES: type IV pilus secretin family protein [unclassified Halomonas]AQU83400.1 type II and III secretion system protein [Halomonas sp. 'Soap Lake \